MSQWERAQGFVVGTEVEANTFWWWPYPDYCPGGCQVRGECYDKCSDLCHNTRKFDVDYASCFSSCYSYHCS
ncbi:hypothetical protein ZOSMA_67G00190 [Zostera marina]|uniref:Uncharacterized protein n=1 Tax=Zostera marina TaxID=29655 RepID=A0A0K9NTZ1_ZOSMR|nr:hypothetical protein ZOSMA_67G00190 [Zostera marina]